MSPTGAEYYMTVLCATLYVSRSRGESSRESQVHDNSRKGRGEWFRGLGGYLGRLSSTIAYLKSPIQKRFSLNYLPISGHTTRRRGLTQLPTKWEWQGRVKGRYQEHDGETATATWGQILFRYVRNEK